MKRVAILTGKLGGYQSLRPLIRMLSAHPETEPVLLVADQHNDEKFGDTSRIIKEDFPSVSIMPIEYTNYAHRVDDAASMLGDLAFIDADLLVVLGDRLETLCGALAALEQNIPIAHIQAGDRSGGLDEKRRRAISQMSSLWFCSTLAARYRLLAQGITPKKRVHEVGDPHIDSIVARDWDQNWLDWFLSAYPGPLALLHLHPDTLEPEKSGELARETLAAVRATLPNHKIIAVYPCSDQGHDAIIEELQKNRDLLDLYPALPPRRWHALMSAADLLIGNSSAGLIEAPYFGLPSVNIGSRQMGRDGLENTITVAPFRQAISKGIRLASEAPPRQARMFGAGNANEKIFNILLKELGID